jgi:hypothetical protein
MNLASAEKEKIVEICNGDWIEKSEVYLDNRVKKL